MMMGAQHKVQVQREPSIPDIGRGIPAPEERLLLSVIVNVIVNVNVDDDDDDDDDDDVDDDDNGCAKTIAGSS
jgi:hypothetical protein